MRLERQRPRSPARAAFTLIELLIVLGIIAILMALTASVAWKAYVYIKRSNTERTIERILQRFEKNFEKLKNEAWADEPSAPAALLAFNPTDTQEHNDRRGHAIQHKLLVKWNFPMNYREIGAAVDIDPVTGTVTGHPSAVAMYKLMIQMRANDPTRKNPATGFCVANNPYTENAACMYLIYLHLGGTRDDFTGSEVVDTDGDGIPEFVDAFGNPLRFYRWPTDCLDPAPGVGYATNVTRVESAYKQSWKDIQDPELLLYEPNVVPAQRWQEVTITTPFGGNYKAVDVFEGRADNPGNPAEALWLRRMWLHRLTMEDQAVPQSGPRTPRPIYAPLTIVSAGLDGEFGLLNADEPDEANRPSGRVYPPGFISPPFTLRPDPMMILSQYAPAGATDPYWQRAVWDAPWVPVDERRRLRELDNLYTYRFRIAVTGGQ